MVISHTHHTAFEAHMDTAAGANGDALWHYFLASLRSLYPGADIPDRDGVCESCADDGTLIRYGRDGASGFWTAEVVSLSAADHWSSYLMPMPDGTWRTGWTRSGLQHQVEPPPWVECAAHLRLGERVRPHHPPTFAALIAAMSSTTAPTFAQIDQPVIDALNGELDEQRRMLREQAIALRTLRTTLGTATAGDQPAAEPRQWAVADLEEWASENADRITILPRALSEAKKSTYGDAATLYAALEVLADVYPMVRAGQLPRDELLRRCQSAGLTIGGSVDPSRAGMEGSEYFVRWRGRRRFLDQHLGKGSSRDPRWCLRIYFFFDDEAQQVVVGWLPSHLSNSLT